MLIQRIVTALVLLSIVIGALLISENAFLLCMALAFSITLFEWLRIEDIEKRVSLVLSVLSAVVMGGLVLWGVQPSGVAFLTLELAVSCAWLAILAVCFNARKLGFHVKRQSAILLAFLFVFSADFSIVWLMREGGWRLMLSAFVLVWFADIFAYAFGLTFGRNRMAPAISPKKSWEGAAGAYGCVFIAAILAWLFLPHETVLTSRLFASSGALGGALMVFLLVSVSIAGDLFESALKRQAAVKDSGVLLPGHGGFFDRLDAALAVLPVSTTLLLIL